ncbi:MAG: divergent PAP2 family protein [Oscillospiraceae bacterium]|jgi:hypothetical protein
MAKYYNYVLFSAFLAWFSAQFLKTIIYYFANNVLRLERMIGSGGMPSAHSATVCAAAAAVFRRFGFSAPEFAVMFIVTIIVMYDAMGVRREAGNHAKEINRLNRLLEANNITDPKKKEKTKERKELKEFIGHLPHEVIGGAVLGIIIAIIMPVK